MPHSQFSSEEIERRGEAIYTESLRSKVEIPENIGKIISIDIETGGYELADNLLSGALRLLAKHPNAAIHGKRIGYDAVIAIGGTLRRLV